MVDCQVEIRKSPLIGKTMRQLNEIAISLGLPRFIGSQLAKWIYESRVCSIDEMTNISKKNREILSECYCVGRREPLEAMHSADGTIKFLFGEPNAAVEAVYIPDADRATLCVSSQKGCKMNCTFCMTGKQGFHGDLTATEIINQILSIPNSDKLTNVVFMGMGEPMDNIDPVMTALEIMTSEWGLNWSPKRITVSTIGKLDTMKRLLNDSKVHIAISVHSPFHEERLSLMPVEKAYPMKSVMAMLRDYDFAHQRRLSIEYIMWNGLNDDIAHAEALVKLLRGNTVRVNLIRFHAIPGVELKSSNEENMVKFRDYLNSNGVICTIRRSRGEDIFAACGMLAGKNNETKQTKNTNEIY